MQVYGASLKDPAHACLVMELVKGGNLHQRIYDRSTPRLTHLEILQVRSQSSSYTLNPAILCCPLGSRCLCSEVGSPLLHSRGAGPKRAVTSTSQQRHHISCRSCAAKHVQKALRRCLA